MKKTETKIKEVESLVVTGVICDKCGRELAIPDKLHMLPPNNEFLAVNYVQDETMYAAEFCIDCLDGLLGPYVRTIEVPQGGAL